MAIPTSGLLESAPGGVTLVRDAGLNTAKASNLAGFLVDTSGNVTVPGTLKVAGAQTGSLVNILDQTTTTALTAAQSGSLVLWDAAAGFTITLPTPAIGLTYEFAVATSVTSSNHKLITSSASIFLYGGLVMTEAADTNAGLGALFNGSSHVACTMNGSTTGGLIGTTFSVTCTSATLWLIEGIVAGSGSLSTPAATS